MLTQLIKNMSYNFNLKEMKTNIKTHLLWTFLCFMVLMLTSCSEDKEWSEDYDINWPLTTIESVQPLSAVPGDIITVTGENMQFTNVFYIGSFACEVVTTSENQLTVRVPELITQESVISVYNIYRRTFVFKNGVFTPIH